MSQVQPVCAIALIEGDGPISLSHIFASDKRPEWEAELAELSAKLAQKGAANPLRLIDVSIAPADPVRDAAPDMLAALKAVKMWIDGYGTKTAREMKAEYIDPAIAKAEGAA